MGRLAFKSGASETEDDTDFIQMVTELVALRLLQGGVDTGSLAGEIAPILAAQGWASSDGPITPNDVSSAIWQPLRWWLLLTVLDEVGATWELGTARRLTPHTVALNAGGEATALAYLRQRAVGPRHRVWS